MTSKWPLSHDWTNHQISFKPNIVNQLDPAAQKLAVLVSNEFEGITQNGGIGTYYRALSQKLTEDGWRVILLLCQSETAYRGESYSELVHHVFSTCAVTQLLALGPIHQCLLDTAQQDEVNRSFDDQSLCCLFFIQALATDFPDAVIYAEFPEIWGFGYRTIQAKQSGWLSHNCLTGVTSHGSFEWLREINSQYQTDNPQWFWQAHHYEQFSYENADVVYAPSHFLKAKVGSYGWKTEHVKHLPYFVPIVQSSQNLEAPQVKVPDAAIPVVFFDRLDKRKGLCAFIEAIKCLDQAIADQLHIIFMGKVIPLQSSHLASLNSQQYIERELGATFSYTLHTDLSSQTAIEAIANLTTPIVCLTSRQENFPNTALEMGQLPVRLVVSDTGGLRETLALVQRTEAVHWFQPDNTLALVQALTQAIHAYPENLNTIEPTAIDSINHHLLNQKLELMSQAFLETAPKAPTTPTVTIILVCWHSAATLLECLASLAAQTYQPLDVVVLSPPMDESIQSAIAQAQTQFPDYQYATSEADWSLGEAYNKMVEQASGDYVLLFSSDQIAAPAMVEELVTAVHEADAVAGVCPQIMAAAEQPESITFVDGNLLKLLEFNHQHDLTALFSKTWLKEFCYLEERGLQALTWQVFAAAIATDQAIAYYPYPLLVIHPDAASIIPAAHLARERYYLRQYLFQIKPEQWSQRQLNLLLTGFEQVAQALSQVQQQNWQPARPENPPTSRQDQAWMITAQQMHRELVQAQAKVEHLQTWNQELQKGKEWLESQWQAWMLRSQKAEAAWEQARSLIEESKFWKLRQIWAKTKRKLGRLSVDPLQSAPPAFTRGVQEFVARLAGQKIRYYQPTAPKLPTVSVISSCFQEYPYIETTYRSIINQTLQNFEWIIVDDGSIDPKTRALLTSLPQRTAKIRIISHATHQGMATSYNTATAQAEGKYLCFIDFGSVLDPSYLEKCVLFLETHPQVSFVNTYSVVFQTQEHWWHTDLQKLTSLFKQNGMMSHLLYRQTDFSQLGGFDASLHSFADWERCLKAIAQRQLGWTIPEYLDGYRSTFENPPVTAQDPDQQVLLNTVKSRYQDLFANPPVVPLAPQELKLEMLNSPLAIDNPCTNAVFGKRILLFCHALDESEIAKWNCDLVLWLDECEYDVTIVTTSASNHALQEFFYPATPDIFHLPNLLDKAYWLAFTHYIISSRHIDGIVISGSEIAYSFLPLLRLKFPHIALIDYIYAASASQQSTPTADLSRQFIEDLDCQIVPSQRLAKIYRSLNSTAHKKIKVCYTFAEVEAALDNLIQIRQTAIPANPSAEAETEALLLILESLQSE